MKLKKIASLALAGVMAVSMLAGCGTGTGSSSSSSSTTVTATTDVVAIVNAAIKGNEAGVSFGTDADFTKALTKVVTEKGASETAGNLTTALATELKITNTTFDTTNLVPAATGVAPGKKDSVKVYVINGKNESAPSAAYQTAAEVAKVVNALKAQAVDNSNKLFDNTYSDAFVSMVEVEGKDTTYYVIAVGLHVECKAHV